MWFWWFGWDEGLFKVESGLNNGEKFYDFFCVDYDVLNFYSEFVNSDQPLLWWEWWSLNRKKEGKLVMEDEA